MKGRHHKSTGKNHYFEEEMPIAFCDIAKQTSITQHGDGTLDEETRTLISLAIALNTGDISKIQSLLELSARQNIAKEKILETFKITCDVESQRMYSNSEVIYNYLQFSD